MTVTLAELNALPADQFVKALEGLYEHSNWIVRDAAARRPFETPEALIQVTQGVVCNASEAQQKALICAHPELGEAQLHRLTTASQQEQRGAGLVAAPPEQLTRLRQLNAAYRQRHGFPFVVAVKGMTATMILDALAVRLERPGDVELAEALEQIGRIAAIRLAALLDVPPE
ncbi:2-oxo-4-hydroxy-4-carboxy-5-ureidoimidazoline decarboxylase [Larsenimonas rhizosphaerae]|uniref:2-oxo-4-hydroxy-4-carboxy-5-ureidoimidazoline decarboxylase n=1 Tax=Larsenimonas rhizosphaerae TaxID=2944682 RepID=A0AA41ZFZ8_9GAMM|nr:2-oxo-4-hydroxy-4-carboxy-5-ureidoimidazoline decarboxylase [Larsenimonas rhizosphaerae]MCX2523469.1 2-oxo-4-hydroxy-4-carboxy-5-ureidoimidazoline decarboxylase [Larsenimonas rhizosphaerae]